MRCLMREVEDQDICMTGRLVNSEWMGENVLWCFYGMICIFWLG